MSDMKKNISKFVIIWLGKEKSKYPSLAWVTFLNGHNKLKGAYVPHSISKHTQLNSVGKIIPRPFTRYTM